jgi:two-component system sensor histidine kinase AlgZ
MRTELRRSARLPANPESKRHTAQAFLPDFCAAGTLLVIVLVGELVAIVLTLASHGGDGQFLVSLSKTSLFVLWLSLLGAALLCQLRSWLERAGKTAAFVLGFVILNGLCLLLAEVAWQLMRALGQTAIFDDPHGTFILRTFAIGSIIIALGMRYLYVSSEWRRSVVLEAQARISALQALIRPHFLFNSMNTIASLTRSNPQKAEEAVEDLSDLLRVTLQSPQDMSSLQQELDIAKTYERIEKLRLDDRLSVRWELGDVPENVRLPTFTIQPLLENAIYHGIELLPGGGEIVVSGRQAGDDCVIAISNPVAGGPARSSDGNKMALSNIQQRFELAFAGSGSVEPDERDGLYTVTLRFPVRADPA